MKKPIFWPFPRQKSFVFEVTQRCNHDCLHCYNVWKNPCDYPSGELDTAQTIEILGKMVEETRTRLVSLSGGEPLLRDDIREIVHFLVSRSIAVNMITNGSLVDERMVASLIQYKISLWELPLLSVDEKIHDRLSDREGAWKRVTTAITILKANAQRVVAVFVASRLNLPAWKETAELAIALGADALMFNRFNPGGRGFQNLDILQANPQEISFAMEICQQISKQYRIPIACSVPMHPCLFDTSHYKNLTFGFCAAGTSRAYYTLDPIGNVRPCNHSPLILGNIRDMGFWDMTRSEKMKRFVSAHPKFCAQCALKSQCQGGCKAAAEACYGSIFEPDPFLMAFQSRALPKRQ